MKESTLRRNIALYYGASFFSEAYFPLAVSLLYYHDVLGLSFTQGIVLILSSWISSMVLDLYTGTLADRKGQRWSYMVGTIIFIGCSVVPPLFFSNFAVLCGLSVIGGVGMALISNALDALMANILHHDKKRFRHVNAHRQVATFLGRAPAALIGGWLYTIDKTWPFWGFVAASCLAATLVFFMNEPKEYRSFAPQKSCKAMAEVLRHLRFHSAYVWHLIVFGALLLWALDTLFMAYQPFFGTHHYSTTVIGVILACVSLASALGSWTVKYLHHRGRRASTLAIGGLSCALNGLAFLTENSFIVFVGVVLMGFGSGLYLPTIRLIVSETTAPRMRTGVLSAASTVSNIGIMAGFITAGLIADHGSATWTGATALSILGVGFGFYTLKRRTFAQQRAEPAFE